MPEASFRRSMQNYNRHEMRDGDGAALGAPEAPVLLARAATAVRLQPDDIADLTHLQTSLVHQILGVSAVPITASTERAALHIVIPRHMH